MISGEDSGHARATTYYGEMPESQGAPVEADGRSTAPVRLPVSPRTSLDSSVGRAARVADAPGLRSIRSQGPLEVPSSSNWQVRSPKPLAVRSVTAQYWLEGCQREGRTALIRNQMGGNAAKGSTSLLPPDFLRLAQLEERRFTKPKVRVRPGEIKLTTCSAMAARKLEGARSRVRFSPR